jgi:CheY-like chemotaxis protein
MQEYQKMKIMVVDDEADVELLFRQRFRREIRADKAEFHFALSGEAALDYLQRGGAAEIVMILSDINMPGMNGLELLRNIKETFPT